MSMPFDCCCFRWLDLCWTSAQTAGLCTEKAVWETEACEEDFREHCYEASRAACHEHAASFCGSICDPVAVQRPSLAVRK